MKLQVTQENLNRALNAVARIASSRTALPILANVAIRTTNNRLAVATTNLDVAITCFIGAKVSQEGSTTVPAHLTQDFIASLPSGVVDLKLDENKLKITSGEYSSVINSVSAEDFPTMPEIKDGKKVKLPAGEFKTALNQVLVAASRDETRPVLTGVYLAGGGNLTLAATDSYRLAEKTLKHKLDLEPIIVPASALNELIRILPDDGELTINYNNQQISFSTDDVELVARLIDGKYPPYQNLIPTKFATSALIARDELASIVKVASLFARENAGSVTINMDEDEQKLSIHSIASQLGENTSSGSAKITGSGSITLNSRYVTDALNALSEAKEVFIGFNGKLEPVVLKNSANADSTHIVMPLKS